MNYYALGDKLCFSNEDLIGCIDGLVTAKEKTVKDCEDIIYYLMKSECNRLKRSFCISQPDMLFMKDENINILFSQGQKEDINSWIEDRIKAGKVMGINTSYQSFADAMENNKDRSLRIHVLGLGDVGGTFLTGLRLMGSDSISTIGIYDLDPARIERWVMEAGQIYAPFYKDPFPDVVGIDKDELFNCDVFVFCASVGVPKVGDEKKDVRLVQYEGNSKILNIYGKIARECGFKGLFAVVSDPVDMLCKSLFESSNRDQEGNMDYRGLAPEQIKGYGLGVMNARAVYYAKNKHHYYEKDGRAFGPHGKGLIIADSIKDYNIQASDYLTEKATTANIDVRNAGYKPYIAPALSSGALSVIATIRGEWHYSTNYINGVFMGSLNRNTKAGLELERLNLPEILQDRINKTYNYLRDTL